jgi:hypothetical protein
MGLDHPGHRTRDSDRQVPVDTRIFAEGSVHIAGRSSRCRLTVVQSVDRPFMATNDHESAASNVACLRVHDSERKPDCNSSVDGVAALLENVAPHLAGNRTARDDHGGWPIGHPCLAAEAPRGGDAWPRRNPRRATARATPGHQDDENKSSETVCAHHDSGESDMKQLLVDSNSL